MKRRFWIKLVVYGITTLLLVGVLVGVAVYSGEAMPLQMVVDQQKTGKLVIYNPMNDDKIFTYRLVALETHHPDVVVVGSSRATLFNGWMLDKTPGAFYNTSTAGWHFPEVRAMVENILRQDVPPSILILSIDQDWLSTAWSDITPDTSEVDITYLLTRTRFTWENILTGQVTPAMLYHRATPDGTAALGMRALRRARGYRNDGSLEMTVNAQAAAQERDRALAGETPIIAPAPRVSDQTIQDIATLLELAQSRGVTVIGFSAAIMPSAYDMLARMNDYRYITDAAQQLDTLFDRYGFYYFDYSDGALVGGRDEQFTDATHGGELFTLQLYMDMLEVLPEVLGAYSDPAYLQQVADAATDPFDIWDAMKQ